MRFLTITGPAVLLLSVTAAACSGQPLPGADGPAEARSMPDRDAAAMLPDEDSVYARAARTAWSFMDRNYQPATGFVKSQNDYADVTTWDVASAIAGHYAARRLDLLDESEYHSRLNRLLNSLATVELYDGRMLNRSYSAETGEATAAQGMGWSATDIGRLLIWLEILRRHEPRQRAAVERVVARLRLSDVVEDGYMRGETVDSTGVARGFLEGRIGYEQYAARGLAFWGHAPEYALELHRNAQEVDLWGYTLLQDGRGLDRLNSEPFVMMGLEMGWDAATRELAENVLGVQEERYRRTGQITMVSEDAVAVPPYYFYYYCIYCNGQPFVVDVAEPGKHLDEPRWVSTKATFGWHTLWPSDYTRRAMRAIEPAHNAERGWSSGVFEGTGESTETQDINTAAIILTSALYRRLGHPILAGS